MKPYLLFCFFAIVTSSVNSNNLLNENGTNDYSAHGNYNLREGNSNLDLKNLLNAANNNLHSIGREVNSNNYQLNYENDHLLPNNLLRQRNQNDLYPSNSNYNYLLPNSLPNARREGNSAQTANFQNPGYPINPNSKNHVGNTNPAPTAVALSSTEENVKSDSRFGHQGCHGGCHRYRPYYGGFGGGGGAGGGVGGGVGGGIGGGISGSIGISAGISGHIGAHAGGGVGAHGYGYGGGGYGGHPYYG